MTVHAILFDFANIDAVAIGTIDAFCQPRAYAFRMVEVFARYLKVTSILQTNAAICFK